MLDHLELKSRDVEGAVAFYQTVLAPLGYTLKVDQKARGFGDETGLHFFIVDGEPSANVHFAFRAKDRAAVRSCFESGRRTAGLLGAAPALAPSIHPNYYAGYLRDPDGHVVEFVCHAAE